MGTMLMETITIMVAGMMAGNELCVSLVNARLRRLDERTHFDATRALAALLGTVMPFWYAATFLLTGLVAFRLHAAGTAAGLAAGATLLFLASIVYTVAALVPINNRIAAGEWDTRPDDWKQARQRWDTRHAARVALLTLALACLVLACLSGRATAQPGF